MIRLGFNGFTSKVLSFLRRASIYEMASSDFRLLSSSKALLRQLVQKTGRAAFVIIGCCFAEHSRMEDSWSN